LSLVSKTVEVTLDDTVANAYFLTGRVTVEEQAAVRVTFACMRAPGEEGVA
jgi:hypothetical protein